VSLLRTDYGAVWGVINVHVWLAYVFLEDRLKPIPTHVYITDEREERPCDFI
jgi:hypothetical protein